MVKLFFTILFLISSITLFSQDFINDIDPKKNLSDFGDLYTKEQEEKIEHFLVQFEKAISFKLRICTLDSLSEDRSEFTKVRTAIFNKWLVSDYDKAKGILIIYTKKNKFPFFYYGSESTEIFTKEEAKYLFANTLYYYAKTQNYYKGTNEFLKQTTQLINDCKKFNRNSIIDTVSRLQLDHVFVMPKEKQKVVKLLEDNGFKKYKYATEHKGQGTSGEYFHFLNFYLELLSIENSSEANSNLENIGTDYSNRGEWQSNKSCPFGIGFSQIPYDTIKIPFKTKFYRSEWMNGSASIQMATSNNNNLEPAFFVLSPSIRNKMKLAKEVFDAEKENSKFQYLNHTNNVETLTGLTIYTPLNKDQISETFKYFSKFTNVKIIQGKEHLIILEFDDRKQGKEVDLEKEIGMKIYY